jgi:hypothetical protein
MTLLTFEQIKYVGTGPGREHMIFRHGAKAPEVAASDLTRKASVGQ